jgi:hypothetical protein
MAWCLVKSTGTTLPFPLLSKHTNGNANAHILQTTNKCFITEQGQRLLQSQTLISRTFEELNVSPYKHTSCFYTSMISGSNLFTSMFPASVTEYA